MEKNKKYYSSHSTNSSLSNFTSQRYDHSYPTHIRTQASSKMQGVSRIDTSLASKQSNLFPYQNQYSIMNKQKKTDAFLDMQSYFGNLYGKKRQMRMERDNSFHVQKQKQNRSKYILPSILQQQNSNFFENELYKMKIEQLQQRINRIEPFQAFDYSRFPPINQMAYGNQQCYCQMNCHMNHDNQLAKHQRNSHSNQNKPSQKRKFTKQQRKKLLRKFRIYGYAVYFCLFLPHYSLLFSHFKLKDFLQKYLVEGNMTIRNTNQKIIQQFKQIALYEQIRHIHQEHQQKKDQKGQSRSRWREQEPKIKISSQQSSQNYVVNLNILRKIISHIIQSFDSLVQTFDEQIYDYFGVGTLNTSYYGDQMYVIEQMPFLSCHPQKGNLKLNNNQETALLLSSLVIKKIIYQYLVRLAVDPQWHEELASLSTLKKKELAFFKLVCKEIQLCAFFLYQLAIKNFYRLIESEEPGNLYDQPQTSLVLPLKTMKFPSLLMAQSQKQLFNYGFQSFVTKPPIAQSSIKSEKSNRGKRVSSRQIYDKHQSKRSRDQQQQQVFNQYTLLIQEDPLNLVHNDSQFGQLSKIIKQHMKSSYEKAEKSVMKLVDKLMEKVYAKRKKNYTKIRQRILRKKYILTQEHQILQGIAFQRNNQEKKQIDICRKMLQLYMQSLIQHQIQAKDQVSSLASKKHLTKKINGSMKSSSTQSIDSFISVVTN